MSLIAFFVFIKFIFLGKMQSTKNDLVHQVHYIFSKHIQHFCFHVHFHFSHVSLQEITYAETILPYT